MFFKFLQFCFQNALEQITSSSFQELSWFNSFFSSFLNYLVVDWRSYFIIFNKRYQKPHDTSPLSGGREITSKTKKVRPIFCTIIGVSVHTCRVHFRMNFSGLKLLLSINYYCTRACWIWAEGSFVSWSLVICHNIYSAPSLNNCYILLFYTSVC